MKSYQYLLFLLSCSLCAAHLNGILPDEEEDGLSVFFDDETFNVIGE